MFGFLLLPMLAAVCPALAQTQSTPLMGTTLSFLHSDQIGDCPASSTVPTFHTTVIVPERGFLCLDVADLFNHPNRTNVTYNNFNVPYSLTNTNAWNSSGNFSGIRYTNGYSDPNKDSGPATYWMSFYKGERCLQMDEPYLSFSCAETDGKCFQFPFNIGSFSLVPADEDTNDKCALNNIDGTSAGTKFGGGYGMPILLSGLIAAFIMV